MAIDKAMQGAIAEELKNLSFTHRFSASLHALMLCESGHFLPRMEVGNSDIAGANICKLLWT